MQKRKNGNTDDSRRNDLPDGLISVAANNKPFAERLIGVFRLAKAGAKNGER